MSCESLVVSFAANSRLLTHFNMANEIGASLPLVSLPHVSPMCKNGDHVALSAHADLIVTCLTY